MYKVRNGLVPDYVGELFNFKNKVYSLRNSDFNIPRYSTVRYGKHSIRYLGPYLCSRLGTLSTDDDEPRGRRPEVKFPLTALLRTLDSSST